MTGLFVLTLLAPVFVLEDQVDDEFVMLPRVPLLPRPVSYVSPELPLF